MEKFDLSQQLRHNGERGRAMKEEYRGYILEVDPTRLWFGERICWIKQGGLPTEKRMGRTEKAAVKAAKRWVDWRRDNGE